MKRNMIGRSSEAVSGGTGMQGQDASLSAVLPILEKISVQLDALTVGGAQGGGRQNGETAGGGEDAPGNTQEISAGGQISQTGDREENYDSQEATLPGVKEFERLLEAMRARQGSSASVSEGSAGSRSGGHAVKKVKGAGPQRELAAARFELAQELEASLESLQKVIADSRRVADKISRMLEEDHKNK